MTDENRWHEFKASETDPRRVAQSILSREALRTWKTDTIFSPYFHESGILLAGSTPELIEQVWRHDVSTQAAEFAELNTPPDFRKTARPGALNGQFSGWKGWLKKEGGGWFNSQKAMLSVYVEARRLGAKMLDGSPQGKVTAFIYEDGDVVGVNTADGSFHPADHVILTTGVSSDQMLDFKNQLRPIAFTLCHLQLTSAESRLYTKMPVFVSAGQGFFIEADKDQGHLKICDAHPGYLNMKNHPGRGGQKRSVPFHRHQIPLEAEERIRGFLRQTAPQIAERPFALARVCWDVDTPDRMFLIDRHPDYPSLLVAVGGSGTGAMHMPSIGGFIADTLEGRLQNEIKQAVRWRPETAVDRDWWSTQGRFGGPNQVMDLQDIDEDNWTKIEEESSPVGYETININE